MKTLPLVSVGLLALGLAFTSGCAGTSAPVQTASRSARTFAIAASLPDGTHLSAAQWAVVRDSVAQELAASGATLVDNISLAEKIIRVVFTPSLTDPASGTAVVLSVKPNPLYAFNRPTFVSPGGYSMTSYGYTSYGSPYSFSTTGYYYPNSGYEYYGGGSVIVPTRDDHPKHQRPTQPEDCPPGQDRPNWTNHRDGGTYVHDGRSNPDRSSPNDGYRGHWNSGDTSTRDRSTPSENYHRYGPTNENGGSRTERTADYSGNHSERSSHSYSESSRSSDSGSHHWGSSSSGSSSSSPSPSYSAPVSSQSFSSGSSGSSDSSSSFSSGSSSSGSSSSSSSSSGGTVHVGRADPSSAN